MTAVSTEIQPYRMRGLTRYAEIFRKPEPLPFGLPVSELPTEDDLPCDDGEPMETPQHHEQMDILIYSLRAYWKKSRRYFIGGNMFLHFELDAEKTFRGPDFFLATDVDDRQRKSWVVWQEEGKFPDVIVELLSDTTRKTDKKEKKKLYSRVFRTSEYYIYDPFSHEFEGYRLSGLRYKTVKPDREKKIYSPVTGLWLIVKGDWLRWMTRDGCVLPTYEELSEQERLIAEQERLIAEQERQIAGQERQRAEQERRRAEQAEKELDAERQRADQLAAKLRELGFSSV